MCVTIMRACFRWCGMIQYSALVNSDFNNKFNTFFGLNLTLVYTFPMCMAWRFHFPIRNYDFKCFITYEKLFHTDHNGDEHTIKVTVNQGSTAYEMGNSSITDITIQRFLETLGVHFIYRCKC